MTTSNTTVTLPLVNARKVDGALVNTLVNNNDRGSFTLARSAAGGYVLRSPAPRAPGYGAINTAILSVIVPSNYAAGASALSVALSVAVLAVIGRTAQSVGTCSLSVSRPNADGSVTAIPVTSEPLALPAPQTGGPFPTYSQLTFDVSGAEINPGDELLLTLQTQFTESGQGNTLIQIALAQVIFSEQNFATA